MFPSARLPRTWSSLPSTYSCLPFLLLTFTIRSRIPSQVLLQQTAHFSEVRCEHRVLRHVIRKRRGVVARPKVRSDQAATGCSLRLRINANRFAKTRTTSSMNCCIKRLTRRARERVLKISILIELIHGTELLPFTRLRARAPRRRASADQGRWSWNHHQWASYPETY